MYLSHQKYNVMVFITISPILDISKNLEWAFGFLVAQKVNYLPVIQETWVQSQDQEDPLEKEIATHSSTLAWKIPWMEEPGRLQSMGSQRVRHK